MRRVVGPAAIAALAVHLRTNTAVTGATFNIDGQLQAAMTQAGVGSRGSSCAGSAATAGCQPLPARANGPWPGEPPGTMLWPPGGSVNGRRNLDGLALANAGGVGSGGAPGAGSRTL